MSILLFPFKVLKWYLKLSGVRGALLLLLGIALGMLFAPERGAVLRARLRARMAEVKRGRVAEDVDPVV